MFARVLYTTLLNMLTDKDRALVQSQAAKIHVITNGSVDEAKALLSNASSDLARAMGILSKLHCEAGYHKGLRKTHQAELEHLSKPATSVSDKKAVLLHGAQVGGGFLDFLKKVGKGLLHVLSFPARLIPGVGSIASGALNAAADAIH